MAESEVDQFTMFEFPNGFDPTRGKSIDPNEVAWSLSYGAAISVTRKKYIINAYRFSNCRGECSHALCLLRRRSTVERPSLKGFVTLSVFQA
ncbi:hypothetical protein K1719_046737 [Acacia pycnantha]|nr:hypothetical protein K1719_046737 [Acacia pycnantha]